MRDAARSWSTQIVAHTEENTQAGSGTPEPPQSPVPFWRSSRVREHEKTATNLLLFWTGLGPWRVKAEPSFRTHPSPHTHVVLSGSYPVFW